MSLHRSCGNVMFALGGSFRGSRPGVDSAFATVEADMVVGGVVDHGFVDVGVVDDGGVHVGDGGVVVKLPAAPFAAVEAYAAVAEAVVNAAVEAYVRAPISPVPEVDATAPAPIARGPEKARLRREHPGARNPEVTIVAIGPVPRRPKIALPWTDGLGVNGQSRRANVNRDSHRNLGGCGGWEKEKDAGQQKPPDAFHSSHVRAPRGK